MFVRPNISLILSMRNTMIMLSFYLLLPIYGYMYKIYPDHVSSWLQCRDLYSYLDNPVSLDDDMFCCWGNMLSTLTPTTTSIVWFRDVPSTTSRETRDTSGPMLWGRPLQQEMGQMERLNAGAPGRKSWEEERSWDSIGSNVHRS